MGLSKIIQGCMTYGEWGKQLTTHDIAKRIESNVENGITSFDHADIYGGYTTEADFGKGLQASHIQRSDIQIISKCGLQLPSPERGNQLKHYQYDADYIVAQARQSISNLQCDYLDVFLLHRPSPLMQKDEIAKAISLLKSEGLIKAFGVSNFSLAQIDYLSSSVEILYNQIQISCTHLEALENDHLYGLSQRQIQPMAWQPLGEVFKLDSDHNLKICLSELSSKYNLNEAQLAIAFLNKLPFDILPVIGTTSVERSRLSMEATQVDLELQDWFRLYEASRGHEVA
ncbi:aldo/keto reductase [Psychroflexus sediminis]|uniref:Predicted oxidoreductase n=1 Tax=Psychroflexus sediminis TaxID=470826 RepID=A0A1G7TRF2_9FLAO|nr:aldo/keto reductase [Psychroflexus sediminis]SDG37865.1 Predicted oxidoreductase [Psychroflexus sediminis]